MHGKKGKCPGGLRVDGVPNVFFILNKGTQGRGSREEEAKWAFKNSFQRKATPNRSLGTWDSARLDREATATLLSMTVSSAALSLHTRHILKEKKSHRQNKINERKGSDWLAGT